MTFDPERDMPDWIGREPGFLFVSLDLVDVVRPLVPKLSRQQITVRPTRRLPPGTLAWLKTTRIVPVR